VERPIDAGGGMLETIGQLLPLMAALALSSVPIMVTITLLLEPQSGARTLGFLIGWLVGLFAVTGLLTFFAQAIPGAGRRRSEPVVGLIEIVLGLALMGYGVLLFVRRRTAELETELPKSLRKVAALKPVAALGLALALNLRPKSLLLASAAALILGTSGLPGSEMVVVLLVFTLVSGSTVAVPIVFAFARPTKVRRPLQATERWLLRNGRVITIVVALLVGVMLVGNGMSRL
jgi:Sap, sulfolipid-1-addressing protein